MWIATKLTPESQRLTPTQLRELADTLEAKEREVHGDGRAVFFADPTDEEFEQYEREEVHGWRGFFQRLGLPTLTNDNDTTPIEQSLDQDDQDSNED